MAVPAQTPAPDSAPGPAEVPPPLAARRLLRGARSATLATATGGQPFAALVTPAVTPDLAVLLLLSDLSEHTRHLRADPRCALLVQGTVSGINPQTAPRVTVTGLAEIVDDPALRARYLRIHPYADLYAGFGDFHLWRLRPMGGQFVGGFARAARLREHDLVPDADAVGAVASAEDDIVAHCNADHADAMAVLARHAGAGPGAWRMVGCDTDGCDLALDQQVVRADWLAPVDGPDAVRAALIRLLRAARAATPASEPGP